MNKIKLTIISLIFCQSMFFETKAKLEPSKLEKEPKAIYAEAQNLESITRKIKIDFEKNPKSDFSTSIKQLDDKITYANSTFKPSTNTTQNIQLLKNAIKNAKDLKSKIETAK